MGLIRDPLELIETFPSISAGLTITFVICNNYLSPFLAPYTSHNNIFFCFYGLRDSNINGKLCFLKLNLLLTLQYLQSAFELRAWSLTHTERMQLREGVTFRRYQKCWKRAGIAQQSNSDFVRMWIWLPLANSLVSGQSICSSPFDCAPGTRLGDPMPPLRELRVPPQASDPTAVFLCDDYIEITGSRLIPPAAASKRVGGLFSPLPKSLSKINKATYAFWLKDLCKHIYATLCGIWLSNKIPWAKLQYSCFQKNKWEDPYISLKCI